MPRDAPNAARLEALHLAALWSIAVAQPVLDVVGRSPEFFVAHDASPTDLLVLVAFLCFGIPAGCVLLIHLTGLSCGWRWRRRAAATLIGGLAGAVALAAFKPLGGESYAMPAAVVLITASTGTDAYLRFPPVRLFVSFLAPAIVAVPAAFLLSPGVGRVLAPTDEVGALDGVSFASTPPGVVVVFDQFQLTALLDSAGNIDRATFPNFAALADDATWFRNATAVANMTIHALPAVVTGKYPSRGRLPAAADHPANPFTLLGSRYRLHVEEPLTELCPESLCPAKRPWFGARLAGVLRDLAVVYPRVLLPDRLVAFLPPVNQTWNDFAANAARETGQRRGAVSEGAARKFRWFETGNPLDVPTPEGRYETLIGRAVDPLRTAQSSALEVVVDALPLMREVDPDADFIPAHITGAVVGKPDGAPAPVLALAVHLPASRDSRSLGVAVGRVELRAAVP